MRRVDKTEAYLNTLPATHQDMLFKYRDHLHHIRYCIDENFQIIRKLIEDVDNLFENANQSVLPNSSHENGFANARVRAQDLDKVCYILYIYDYYIIIIFYIYTIYMYVRPRLYYSYYTIYTWLYHNIKLTISMCRMTTTIAR